MTDDIDAHDYLGTRFDCHADGSITLTQPRMIDPLLTIVGLDSKTSNVKLYDCLAISVLHDDPTANLGAKHGTTAPP